MLMCELTDLLLILIFDMIVTGQGGVGKSTTLKHIALQWAADKVEQLKRFDYVFHVALKHVKPGDTIEEHIVKQHKLGGYRVTVDEILTILTKQKVCGIELVYHNSIMHTVYTYF